MIHVYTGWIIFMLSYPLSKKYSVVCFLSWQDDAIAFFFANFTFVWIWHLSKPPSTCMPRISLPASRKLSKTNYIYCATSLTIYFSIVLIFGLDANDQVSTIIGMPCSRFLTLTLLMPVSLCVDLGSDNFQIAVTSFFALILFRLTTTREMRFSFWIKSWDFGIMIGCILTYMLYHKDQQSAKGQLCSLVWLIYSFLL